MEHKLDEESELAFCTVCGGAEGSLPSECPRYKLSYALSELIYRDFIDYRNGNWIFKKDTITLRELIEILE